jgi:arachidonate 15-lipoxygenase
MHGTLGYTIGEIRQFADRFARLTINKAQSNAARKGHDIEKAAATAATEIEKVIKDCISGKLSLAEIFREVLNHASKGDVDSTHPLTMADYENMFHSLDKPALAKLWDEDWCFAYLTVAGPIPCAIRCIEELPANFPVTNEHYRLAMGPDADLTQDLAAKKVFLLDFALLDKFTGGRAYGLQKYCYAPLALFAWKDTTEHKGFGLTPVAIQCGQRPGADFPIWTPADGWRWKMARHTARVATGCFRGAYLHYGGLHVVMERIVIATRRALAENHPILLALNHNFERTLSAGIPTRQILSPGEAEATLIAPQIDATVQLILMGVNDFGFDTSVPPALFDDRGLGDPAVLPMYPFREDTTKLWEATLEFVRGYVKLYYTSDQDVVDDTEVQSWVAGLQAQDGARLNGVGNGGKVETVDQLIALMASIVYRGSSFHAAVNYAGWDLFAFPPAMAYAGFAPPPTAETANTEESFMAMLPPLEFAFDQMSINGQQTTIWLNSVGVYPPGYFEDSRVEPLAKAIEARMTEIKAEVEAANEKRPYPYIYQLPWDVTSSLQC